MSDRTITIACCARCGAWDLTYGEPCLDCSHTLGRGVYKRRRVIAVVVPEDAAWLAEKQASIGARQPEDDDTDWGDDA